MRSRNEWIHYNDSTATVISSPFYNSSCLVEVWEFIIKTISFSQLYKYVGKRLHCDIHMHNGNSELIFLKIALVFNLVLPKPIISRSDIPFQCELPSKELVSTYSFHSYFTITFVRIMKD